jgi:hypothetical protein
MPFVPQKVLLGQLAQMIFFKFTASAISTLLKSKCDLILFKVVAFTAAPLLLVTGPPSGLGRKYFYGN